MTEREGKKSGYRGVNYHKAHQKWQASIQRDGKRQHLGLFATAEEAAMAYDAAARHPEGSRACAIFLGARACHRKCPGGQPCVLDSDVYHKMHICDDASCICHDYEQLGVRAKVPVRTNAMSVCEPFVTG